MNSWHLITNCALRHMFSGMSFIVVRLLHFLTVTAGSAGYTVPSCRALVHGSAVFSTTPRVASSSKCGCDLQVKVRGVRIELGEIENTLGSQPGIQAAVCKVIERPATKEKCLVAYYTPASLPPHDVIDASRSRLPQHMVPHVAVPLDAMPLMSSGKVDLKGLPEPDWEAMATGRHYEAPRNDLEQQLHDVLGEVLFSPHTFDHVSNPTTRRHFSLDSNDLDCKHITC